MKVLLLTLVIIGLFSPLVAQNLIISSEFDIDAHISRILLKVDEASNEEYYNLLYYFFDKPIDLNSSNGEELSQLGLLSSEQIVSILNYLEETGPFQSLYELQSINNVSIDDIRKFAPFITIAGGKNLKTVFSEIGLGNSNYITTGYSRVIPESVGFGDNNFIGSPDRAQMRVRIKNPGHLSIGITAQKDPGENWINNSPLPSPDFLSGHIYLENQGRVKQLVIGDYRLQFGQGLVLGAGFMVGKNSEAVASVKQSNLGVIPYSSITENSYFRGSGVTIKINDPVKVSAFYSNQYLDATPVNFSPYNTVSAIRTTGLHRTYSEINAKDQLLEQVWGSAITFNKSRYSSGLLITGTCFDKSIAPSKRDYNQYYFTGNKLLNYSWFGQVELGNFLLFGELAKTHNKGGALNMGIIGSLSKYINTSLLLRSHAKDFHSFYGLTFSERSNIGNEAGIYWGINLKPTSQITISGYYDMYRFPWLTSSTAAPSVGKEYLVRLNYIMSDDVQGFIQLRNESNYIKEDAGNIDINMPQSLLKSVASLDYYLENPLSFRTRIQYNLAKSSGINEGWLIYQDINYNSMNLGLSIRLLLFDTDDFTARQYTYEKDILFTYNTRMLNGRGVSYYILLKYKPTRNLTARVKWSYVEYLNQHMIGSGNDLIEGNTKNQLNCQLHYTF